MKTAFLSQNQRHTTGIESSMFYFILYGVIMQLSRKCYSLIPTETYPYAIVLEQPDTYKLYWKFDSDSITFELHVRTKGYIGFGISPTGYMNNSDVVIGWVKDGKAHIKVRKGICL